MKKIILILLAVLLLTGCKSGVSQQEYDDLNNKIDTLQSQYDELKNKSSVPMLNVDDKFISKWGNSTFGEDTESYRINEDTAMLIVDLGEAEKKDLEIFFSAFKANLHAFDAMDNAYEIPYLFIKAVDSSFSPVCEFFLDVSNPSNPKSEISISNSYSDIVNEVINETYN